MRLNSANRRVSRDTRMSCLYLLPSTISSYSLPFSTLKVYRKGEAVDYTGPRKADGIISYMTKFVFIC